MTGAAIASGASAWWTAAAVAADAALVAGTSYSSYSSYQQGKAQEQQAKAEAQQMEYQAKLDNERAGIAQLQGEQEAARRSRALAADIGSAYASYAGNGLLVDGKGKDTLGSVLSTTIAEGQEDISTIKDNTALNIWTYQANAGMKKTSALNTYTYGKNMKTAGVNSAFGTGISGVGTLASSGLSVYAGGINSGRIKTGA